MIKPSTGYPITSHPLAIGDGIRRSLCARAYIYTKNQAEGALRNGSRVEKVNSEFGDGHQDGAVGTVVGSLGPMEVLGFSERYAYFVVWDEEPGAGLPVGIREGRVKPLKEVSRD